MWVKFFTFRETGNMSEDEAARDKLFQDNPNIAIIKQIQNHMPFLIHTYIWHGKNRDKQNKFEALVRYHVHGYGRL